MNSFFARFSVRLVLLLLAGLLVVGFTVTMAHASRFPRPSGSGFGKIIAESAELYFGRSPSIGAPRFLSPAAYIAISGLVSLAIASPFWRRQAHRRAQIGLIIGWIAAVPIALVSIFLGGLMIPPLWLWVPGTIFLTIGALLGLAIGHRRAGSR